MPPLSCFHDALSLVKVKRSHISYFNFQDQSHSIFSRHILHHLYILLKTDCPNQSLSFELCRAIYYIETSTSLLRTPFYASIMLALPLSLLSWTESILAVNSPQQAVSAVQQSDPKAFLLKTLS